MLRSRLKGAIRWLLRLPKCESYLGDGWRIWIGRRYQTNAFGYLNLTVIVEVLALWRPLGGGKVEEMDPIMLSPRSPWWNTPRSVN